MSGTASGNASGLLLAIDTSGSSAGLVLAGDGFRDIALLPVQERGAARTEDLAAEATRLLSARGLRPADLSILGAVTGPGSYTGLRSGLAFLRGLAFGGSPVAVGVGSLELLAMRGGRVGEINAAAWPATEGRHAIALYRCEARKAQGVKAADAEELLELEEPRLVSREDCADFLRALDPKPAALIAAESCTEAVAEAAAAAGLELRRPTGHGLEALATLVAARAARAQGATVSEILPLYVGQSSARPNRNRVAVGASSE